MCLITVKIENAWPPIQQNSNIFHSLEAVDRIRETQLQGSNNVKISG